MKDEPKLYFIIKTPSHKWEDDNWKLQHKVMEMFIELRDKGYKISLNPDGCLESFKEENVDGLLAFYIPESLFQEWNKKQCQYS